MIYKVVINRSTFMFPVIGIYLVVAKSGECAADFALKKAKKDYPDERLRVSSVTELEGSFIGRAV